MGEVIESEVTPSRRSVGEGKLGGKERPPLSGCLTELGAVVGNGLSAAGSPEECASGRSGGVAASFR